jgi:hydroxyacylglutathione hydrolase
LSWAACWRLIAFYANTLRRVAAKVSSEEHVDMIHKIFPVGPLQCNCSILGDEKTHEAMVIDPGDQVEGILEILRQEKLTLKQIVITHAHIDHVGGAMKLKAATGAPILMNQNDYALLKMLDMQATWVGMKSPGEVQIDESVSQGRVLKIGEITSQVIDTPGHTEGSICIYFPEEQKLIAGDTLFAGSIGRTDLPGGSMEKIMRSLHNQVLALPDETEVTPGHGPNTTIGDEREMNPFLQK